MMMLAPFAANKFLMSLGNGVGFALTTSRTTSSAHADAYLQHMQDYLEGLKLLFPDYTFHPNHHMALHLHKYIRLYGPVHSWWAFPFERVIGMLQHISTNYKQGRNSLLHSEPNDLPQLPVHLKVNMSRPLLIHLCAAPISEGFFVGLEHPRSS